MKPENQSLYEFVEHLVYAESPATYDGGGIWAVLEFLQKKRKLKISDETAREINRVIRYRSQILKINPDKDNRINDLRSSSKLIRVHTNQGTLDFTSYKPPSSHHEKSLFNEDE